MLTSVSLTSSSCTGSYSGEMALAVVEKTINDSQVLDIPVTFTPLRCHVARQNLRAETIHGFRSSQTAQEISASCRQLIWDHHLWHCDVAGMWTPPPCVHGDLTEAVPRGSFDPEATFIERVRAIDRAPLCLHQHCYTHGQKCPIYGAAKKPDYDLSGLPCPDHSPAGKRLYEEGKTSSVFACHAKLHIANQTPLLIIENVPDRANLFVTYPLPRRSFFIQRSDSMML